MATIVTEGCDLPDVLRIFPNTQKIEVNFIFFRLENIVVTETLKIMSFAQYIDNFFIANTVVRRVIRIMIVVSFVVFGHLASYFTRV